MSDLQIESARIIIAEDEAANRALYEAVLNRGGHHVIASFVTRNEAEVGILELGPDDVHFGIFDGNLTKGETSGEDGKYLISLFKTQVPEGLAIGISGTGEVTGADINIPKPIDIAQLSSYIDQNFPRS